MKFKDSVESTITESIFEILTTVCERYDIDQEDIKRFRPQNQKCCYKFTRGANKNNICGVDAFSNGFCKNHQGQALKLGKPSIQTPVKVTKTTQDIIKWLNTAVPQETTILHRHELGLIHKDTEILFNEDYKVIGVLSQNTINPLTNFEIEYCERMGWEY